MQTRGREKSSRSQKRYSAISLPFVVFGILALGVIGGYQLISYLLQGNKSDMLQNDLGVFSRYLSVYDRESASLVKNIDKLVKAYPESGNIFETHKETIDEARNQIIYQSQSLIRNNPHYARLVQFLDDIHPHKEELLLYLGKNTPKSYLIVLQNSDESRPNGGFFGSFAYVRVLQGKVRSVHIIDSYIGYKTMPWVQLTPPAWSDPIYEGESFGRIAANKFGFTNIDGPHLIELYNKTFNDTYSETYIPAELCESICHRSIDGVIFVTTESLKKLSPGLQKKLWEWQFTNATVDLRRGADLPNKKELYLGDSQDFLLEHASEMIQSFFKNFEELSQEYNFGIYIPTISPGLNEIFTKYHLTTIPNNHTIYTRDTNRSHNKSDGFVNKTSIVRNTIGDILLEQSNNNQIDISTLSPGEYTLDIHYTINVSDPYKNYIALLEEQYDVELTDRERGILVLEPIIDGAGVARLRESKSQVYFPSGVEIQAIEGDYQHGFFESPSGPGVDYIVGTSENNSRKTISLRFRIKE